MANNLVDDAPAELVRQLRAVSFDEDVLLRPKIIGVVLAPQVELHVSEEAII